MPTGVENPLTAHRDKRAGRVRPYRLTWLGVRFVAAALLFDRLAVSLGIGVAAWLLYEVLIRRNPRVLVLTVGGAMFPAAFEYVGRIVLTGQFTRMFHDDADHRLKPNPALGINADGIRCGVEADDLTADTSNIVFLGDSFIFAFTFRRTRPCRRRWNGCCATPRHSCMPAA